MSGITGLVNWKGTATNNAIVRMLERLRHRGKQGSALLCFDDKGTAFPATGPSEKLAHSYLALGQNFHILQSGQPATVFQSKDRRYAIVYDGTAFVAVPKKEDIRAEILDLYHQYGAKCVDYLNGSWAFVIYDQQNQILFGSRDRTGVKPFYFYKNDAVFAFASEQKAFFQLPFFKTGINRGVVFDFFFQSKIESRDCFFENLQELQPAHFLQLDLRSKALTISRYYNLPFKNSLSKYSEKQFQNYTIEIKTMVEASVRNRLSNPDSAASLLSGGLDSSVLVAVAAKLSGIPVKTFTSCFEQTLFDESRWAGQMADHVNANWFKVYPKLEDFKTDLENLAYIQDIPLTSAGTYSQFRAMKLAAENDVQFVLDGQGADALFAGHLPHNVALWRMLLRRLKINDLKREINSTGGIWPTAKLAAKIIIKYSYLPKMGRSIRHQFNLKYFKELSYFNQDFVHENLHRYDLYHQDVMPSLNELLYNEYFGGGMKYLLKCVDRSSMSNSVQALVPYADDLPLMEYLFDVPANYKIRNSVSKVLLRTAFRDMLPKAIVQRTDKMALATPNNQWVTELRPHLRPYFENLPGDIFDRKKLLKDFDVLFKMENPLENYRLFKYYGFALWRKVFNI